MNFHIRILLSDVRESIAYHNRWFSDDHVDKIFDDGIFVKIKKKLSKRINIKMMNIQERLNTKWQIYKNMYRHVYL